MDRLKEISELTRVRVLLFLREPEAVFWVFVFPLLLAAVLGFAFRRGEVPASRVGVLDGDGATRLVETLAGVDHLEAEVLSDDAAAGRRLRKGSLHALLEPGTPPRLLYDPTRPEAEASRLRVLRALESDGRPAAETRLELAPVSAVGSRYVDFLFPGLLGLNLMGTGMWAIGFAVADLRQRKVLKRMLVTPMRRSSFLLSLLLARLVFLALEVTVLTVFGVWLLGIPFRSGIAGFAVLCLTGALAFAGLGVLTTARVRTIQGASGILNLVMMPMWLVSGIFFSYERFPEALQPLIRLLPLTALNDALRDMMLDGAGLLAVAPELAVQAAWGAAAFFVALKVFRWE